jgi:hypothetical protein
MARYLYSPSPFFPPSGSFLLTLPQAGLQPSLNHLSVSASQVAGIIGDYRSGPARIASFLEVSNIKRIGLRRLIRFRLLVKMSLHLYSGRQ